MLSIDQYALLRPYAYHATAHANLDGIRALGRLQSAATLMARAGRVEMLRSRRPAHVPLALSDGTAVWLRDQAPLHAGNAALAGSWSFGDLIEYLNGHVFFWPGGASGPISYGMRHFARYAEERPAILRIPFASLVAANPDRCPLFSRYNSGSPRCTGGRRSPRGPDTFVTASRWNEGPARVVELTFHTDIALPADVEVAAYWGDSWRRL